MSSTTLELNAPVAEDARSNQRELWRRYSKSGHGSAIENKIVEQYLPLVKAVVGRLAMTLPSTAGSHHVFPCGRTRLGRVQHGAKLGVHRPVGRRCCTELQHPPRLRQSGIDEELFDVISGFEALTSS